MTTETQKELVVVSKEGKTKEEFVEEVLAQMKAGKRVQIPGTFTRAELAEFGFKQFQQ